MGNGYTNTLGQKQHKMIDKKFERLLVLDYDEEMSKLIGRDCYICQCDCGVKKSIVGSGLRSKAIKSCGCYQKDMARKLCKQLNLTRDQTGEKNPNYLHGFKCERTAFRKAIKARDKVCQYNDGTKCKGLLAAHHLDGDNYNNDPKNGVLLCCGHHLRVTHGGNVWRPDRR